MILVARRKPKTEPVSNAGSSVRIRAIDASDAPLVLDAFTRLSDRSRQLRFLTSKPRITDSERRYFTEVDHHDHEALVAVSRFDGRIVGGARYIRLPHEPGSAVTVVDDWQGHGLGGQLIAELIERAGKVGVVRFVALVAEDNVVVAGMLRRFGADARVLRRDSDDIEYEIALDGSGVNAARSWLAAG